HDSGYGKGWNLQLTEFDPSRERRIISLASGETFKSTGRVGSTNQLAMQEKKIDTFHLYEESDSRWRVVHRSGQVEILELKGESDRRRAMPVQIFNEQGQWLKLEYTTFSDFPRLTKVTDMRGKTLLTIGRESDQVTLTFPTDVGDATYALVLADSDNRVARIELPTDNLASWRFTYDRIRTIDCISRVRTPTGGFEEVFYQDDGHLFPGSSGRASLPRVTRHVVHPGHGQPSIDTRYTYSANGHNFLGGNAQLDWYDDGLDNLFRQVMEYDYETTETLWVDDKPVRSIQRNFNKFHLLTSETTCHGSQLSDDGKTVVGNYIKENVTTYKLTADRRFDEQPNYCQLPHGVVTRWYLKNNATRNRSQSTSSTYDDHGNLLTHQAVNGIQETYTWYASDEPGYPGNEENFVCHLKEKIETPASGHHEGATARTTHYTYQRLPVLSAATGDMRLQYWIAVEDEQLKDTRDLKTVRNTYWLAESETVMPNTPLLHGRLCSQVSCFPNPKAGQPGEPSTLDTKLEYTYTFETLDWESAQNRVPSVKGTAQILQSAQKLVGFDGVTKTQKEQHSLKTGQLLLNRDDTDTEILTIPDKLRRTHREIVSPGKVEEAYRQYEYHLCANDTDQASQTQFDVKGIKSVTLLDGAYRVIEEQREDPDHEVPDKPLRSDHEIPGEPLRSDHEVPDKPLRSTYKASFDAWGNMVSETEIDWLTECELKLTSRIRYDAWGEQQCVIGPDGVGAFAETDPIGDGSTGPIRREWRQQLFDAAGNDVEDGPKTGVTEVQLGLFDSPVCVRRWIEKEPEEERRGGEKAPEDEPEFVLASKITTEYDGFGRKAKEEAGLSDVSKQVEVFTYDAFDRLLTHSLKEGEVVVRTYAPHSDKDLPMTIKVDVDDKPLLGEQHFDGLDRMILSITGGRQQRYDYLPGQLKPCTVTTPEGVVEYEYCPFLSEEPVQRKLGGKTASYTFDPQNARLSSCEEPGEEGFQRTYYSTGEVRTETRGQYHMSYVYSYRGRIESYIDVLGQTQRYEYDGVGRLRNTSLGALSTTFEHDALGRVLSFETSETDNDGCSVNTLKTTLGYDDLERETSRTFSYGHDLDEVLTQDYDDFDRITKRTLSQGDTVLREESYTYDTRGRLTTYQCTGDQCPIDPYGNMIKSQRFRFDPLDNITHVLTQFGNNRNTATYHFENTQDPTQLTRITNSFGAPYPDEIKLEYDGNGNLIRDDEGRVLKYDALNRLRLVTNREQDSHAYGYDPLNVLSSTTRST
ncbi:RHS repeat domain-containing protein, partial [Pseudomonas alabamensis]|uniref:RHS repeat domain-containing protein n=1 Tax=Pseudomonas alabamensis TaxID=3064349 RepID=UPI003F64A5C1